MGLPGDHCRRARGLRAPRSAATGHDLTPDPDSWYERQAGGYLGSYLKQMSREERDAFATRLQEIVDGYRGEPEWPV
jgi:hypothetical protein